MLPPPQYGTVSLVCSLQYDLVPTWYSRTLNDLVFSIVRSQLTCEVPHFHPWRRVGGAWATVGFAGGMGGAIPGLYLAKGSEAKEWASCPSDVKRRHFVLDGQKLKLFGKRGKTYKGVINLLDVEALRPTTDATAPLGSLELQLRSRSQATLVCIMAPDHSIDDLFMALGNAVPSHATSDDLWRLRMGSRPAPNAGSTHEYRIGKTLGSGTFGKVKLAQRVPSSGLR